MCAAEATQSEDGAVESVAITFPNGFRRTLFFSEGRFTRASATMSGVGTDTDWRVEAGRHLIRVEDQRFEVPGELLDQPARQ